jgi:hypothetical protein
MDSKEEGASRQKSARICSLFPSKRKLNDLKLRNRMKICALSIFLLWSCSLKNAAFIASYAMEVPSIATFYHSCKSASQIARDEKAKFTQCAKTQVDQCKFGLDILAERESRKVMTASEFNSKIITETEITLEACSADFNDLKSALESWSDSNSYIPLHNGTCTAEEKELLARKNGWSPVAATSGAMAWQLNSGCATAAGMTELPALAVPTSPKAGLVPNQPAKASL